MPETPAATAPIFVSTQEAADLLGISRREVVRLLKRGDLVGTSHGRAYDKPRYLVLLASVHTYAYRRTPA